MPHTSAPTHQHSQACLQELAKQMPFLHRATMNDPRVPLLDRMDMLEDIMVRLLEIGAPTGEFLSQVVRSYALLSLEFLKLQRALEKSGKYLHSSEREALDQIYKNKNVFGGYYLQGLLLSQALWPNHFRIAKAFSDTFIPELKRNDQVLEVGVGTGFHLRELLRNAPELAYTGVDISPFAIEFCRKFAVSDEFEDRSVRFIESSVTSGIPVPTESIDHVIMGEVLEHLEQPQLALKELLRITKPGGSFFMTTVVFAANIDHIYLFHTAEEIREMCRSCGWDVQQDWVYPVYPDDKADMRDRPMNVALLLRKPK